MDLIEHRSATNQRKFSVLQADKCFKNWLISRTSSAGCSSRIFYYGNSEGVPFKWEMQPGTPKDPPKAEIIPPLSPPPAVLSSRLPRPCTDHVEQPKLSIRSRLKFWRCLKKIQRIKQPRETSRKGNISLRAATTTATPLDDDRLDQFYSSDCEFMASSPRKSNSSSSSSLSYSNNGHSRQSSSRSSRLGKDSLQAQYGCSPLHLSSVVARVAKRV